MPFVKNPGSPRLFSPGDEPERTPEYWMCGMRWYTHDVLTTPGPWTPPEDLKEALEQAKQAWKRYVETGENYLAVLQTHQALAQCIYRYWPKGNFPYAGKCLSLVSELN